MKQIELIEEKLSNFLLFIDANCPPELRNSFESHRKILADHFMIEFIGWYIYPHKEDLNSAIDLILHSSNVNRMEIRDEVITKMTAYLRFFIDMLEG